MAYEKRREAEKEALRQKVIEVAEGVFLNKEFDNISIDEIADLAGITKRNMHRFFINKKDLFYAVMERILSFLMRMLKEQKEKETDPAKQLETVLYQLFFNYYNKAEIFLLFNRFAMLKKQTESAILPQRVSFLACSEQMREAFTTVCQNGIDKGQFQTELSAREAADLLIASSFGLLAMHEVRVDKESDEHSKIEDSKKWASFIVKGIGYQA
ncbi:MAG: TetR/AcrR family transcriptional regulator [Lachnospiraceae bacterium]|nr:TetR/AcrR family transcriptional regulator [Lachnospiraceae bacterium]